MVDSAKIVSARGGAGAREEPLVTVEDESHPKALFATPELRWALIGTGAIANQMAQALLLADRHLVGVTNRTRAKADAFARRYGIERVYGSLDELLADPLVDAVYISTPHNTHIRFIRAALEAGKHVLCEKAITLDSAELDEARALAAEREVQLMDATTILHMPLYRELGRRARNGDFGALTLAQVNFGSFKEYGDLTNRFYNPRLAGGAMLDIGVYAITAARLFMASQPKEIVSLSTRASTGVDQSSGFVTRNAEGQLGVFSLTLHTKQPKRIDLCFEDCYIEIIDYPRADSAMVVWTSDGHREEIQAGRQEYALLYAVADLEAAVDGDRSRRELIGYTSDVMDIMTRLRFSWGIYYPEEAALARAAGVPVAGETT
ncbi:Gfo/Idh/MocA family protein [Coriobacterium glomerans]|nr:Gfo/Idh/MocA family oxidoreductase [Coriobacterium glomerans]